MTGSLFSARPLSLRKFQHFSGTKVVVVAGEGVANDPVREVTYWFAEDGTLIAHNDSWATTGLAGISEAPSWALIRIRESLAGQTHNISLRRFLVLESRSVSARSE